MTMHSHWSGTGVQDGWKAILWVESQPLINKMLLEHCKSKYRNMSMTWKNYRKAFESVPHN